MNSTRLLTIAAAALVLPAGAAHAQQWPAKPIRFIMPFVPGGGTDLVGRTMAPRLSEGLGQQVVVENRGGAGGNIGVELAAKSEPDGYTMVLGTIGNIAVNPSLYGKLPVDPIRDLAPVSQTSVVMNFLVVHPSLPVKSVQDLIALAKKNPGKVTFGSSGMGAADHLAGELMNRMAGVQMVHVPYKGGGPALSDVLGGHVPIYFSGIGTSLAQMRAGKLRPLGVTTAARSKLLPEVPTVDEATGSKGYEAAVMFGLFAPAKTPPEIVSRLNGEVVKLLNSPEFQARLLNQGGSERATATSPQDMVAYMKANMPRWAALVKDIGARID